MENYEDKDNFFDYSSKEEWIKYIENNVIPLWEYSYLLKSFFEELKIEFNKKFSEIPQEYIPLLLGGYVQGEENFRANSLAKFYLNFFGLDMNRNLWKMQESLSEKVEDIQIYIKETEFIEFVKEICSLLVYGLDFQHLVSYNVPVLNYEELIKDPDKIKDLVVNFYQSVLDIVINYNPKTFFLCSINQITQHFIERAYPRFPQINNVMRDEFGLIVLLWDNPIDVNSNVYQDYTLFCFPEFNPKDRDKSFGGSICTLNKLIWDKFSESSSLRKEFEILFLNVPILKENYINNIKGQLPENYHQNIYYEGILASENPNNIRDSKTSIMEMLDYNFQFLFVNKILIEEIDVRYGKNEISFREI